MRCKGRTLGSVFRVLYKNFLRTTGTRYVNPALSTICSLLSNKEYKALFCVFRLKHFISVLVSWKSINQPGFDWELLPSNYLAYPFIEFIYSTWNEQDIKLLNIVAGCWRCGGWVTWGTVWCMWRQQTAGTSRWRGPTARSAGGPTTTHWRNGKTQV